MQHTVTAWPLRAAALAAMIAVVMALVPGSSASADVPGTSNGGVRIMPLGDSITFGQGLDNQTGVNGGYRWKLWQDLNAVTPVDFVGTLSAGPTNMDRDHEGRSGYTIAQLTNGLTGQFTDGVVAGVAAANPDTILLQVGANDVRTGNWVSATKMRDDLSVLIDRILQLKPNVRLFVASTTPAGVGYDTENDRITAYNLLIPALVATKSSNVRFFDLNSKLTRSDISDDLHPTVNGYIKMSNAWFTELTQSPLSPLVPLTSYLPPSGDIGITATDSDGAPYVSAWGSPGDAPLEARSPHLAGWEKFQFVSAGNGWWALRSTHSGKYANNVNGALIANAANASSSSTWFRWVGYPSQQFALVGFNGKFVSAQLGGGSDPLSVNAPHRLGWETFTWVNA